MLGLLLAMSPRSASYRPMAKHARGSKKHLTTTGVNFRPMRPPCSALLGSCFLSSEFTWSVKLALEKQTSQPNLVMAL